MRTGRESETDYTGGWYRDGLILRPRVTGGKRCGTESGYQTHHHRRDTATADRVVTCRPCLEAHSAHVKAKYLAKKLEAVA